MALGGPYQLEFEVMQMFFKLDTEYLQCIDGIIELDVPESKKGNHYLFKKLVRRLSSEDVEAREEGDLQCFQNLQTP